MSILEKAIQEINARIGEQPSDIIFDGKIHRFGKKDHAWYSAHEWDFNGKPYQTVNFGSWKMGENHTVKSWGVDEESNKNFRKKFQEHTRDAKIRMEQEQQERQEKCRLKWKPIFDGMKSDTEHEYLKFKGIDQLYTSKAKDGVLFVPAYNANRGFVGVQRIYRSGDSFEKLFSAGIEIRGAFCPLKPFRNSEYGYLAEGFATAASIQKAFPEIPVICVFNAGNISPAIENIRHINPKIKIMIAADSDQPDKVRGIKAGEHYARIAANRYSSVHYRVVKFSTNNPSWTDFNDLHQFESLEKVQEQLVIDPVEFAEIIPLGFKDDLYYYTSSENPQITALTANSHTPGHLTGLLHLPYWKKVYGIRDDDGNIIKTDWENAGSTLKSLCRTKGFFDPEMLRGRGVWLDKGQTIINDGEFVFSSEKSVGPINSNFHYLRTKRINYDLTNSMSDQEALSLLGFFGSLTLKDKNDFIYLAAWVVQSHIFAILPWRFHLWISGEKGAGKSTIQKWLGLLTVNPSLNLNSSAAGIRQNIATDARPCIYDENEPDNTRLKEIIEMARMSSSNNDFRTYRGTPTGRSITYATQTVFCMGSIQKGIEKSADLSRFFIVELSREQQDQDEYNKMEERIAYFSSHVDRLVARSVIHSQTVLKNFSIARKVLKNKDVESRQADQIATAIACFYLYFSTEIITEDVVEKLIDQFSMLKSGYTEQNQSNDAQDCYEAIMSMKVNTLNESVYYLITKIIEMKSQGKDAELHEVALGAMGIRYFYEKKTLFIASGSFEIRKRIPAFRDYSSIMRRSNYFVESSQQRVKNFGGQPRGIIIKFLEE